MTQVSLRVQILLIFSLIFLSGCNGVPEDKVNALVQDESQLSSLKIVPTIKSLYVNQTLQFMSSGGEAPHVFTLISGPGTLSSSGFYTAPNEKGQARIRVTDALGSTRDALVNVQVEIGLSPSSQKLNVNSVFQFQTTGGNPPYTYKVTSGSSTIDATGTLTASATAETAVVRVTDSLGYYAESTVSVGNGPIIATANPTTAINSTYQYTVSSGTAPLSWRIISGNGTISSSGLFSAPSSPGQTTIRVTDANDFYAESTITIYRLNKVTVGNAHTCVVLGDTQQVKCLGVRQSGATGDGKFLIGDEASDMGENTPSPKVLGLTTASPLVLSATAYNHCAIFDDGVTRCWGNTAYGQNGGNTTYSGHLAGTIEGYSFPVPADLSNPIVDLTRKGNSEYHQCGIYQDGTLKCWGLNDQGQLGQNNTNNYGSNFASLSIYTVSPIVLGQTAIKVETGWRHTCAILNDKNVKCWGSNDFGQLGLGNMNKIGDEANEMQSLSALNFTQNVVDLALGQYHTCALFQNGTVSCWGRNANGELGLENKSGTLANYGDEAGENPTLLTPISFGAGRTATKIDAGHNHTCALLDNFTMKCWGHGGYGQLGQEDTVARGDDSNEMGANLPIVYLVPGAKVVDISVGGHSSCAVLDTKEIKCWGLNDNAQLGIGVVKNTNIGDNLNEMGSNLSNVNLGSGVTAVTQLSIQTNGTCAIITKNSQPTIKCWGSNHSGLLGLENGSLGDELSDLGANLPVLNLGTNKEIAEITAGGDYSCARFTDGTAKCWGKNDNSVLGTNGAGGSTVGFGAENMGSFLSYLISGSGTTVAKVIPSIISQTSTCGIFNSDTFTNALKCWGAGNNGVLGRDSTSATYYIPTIQPINLGTGRYAVDVAVGQYSTCAILDNGTLKCWGLNNYGQLGLGHKLDQGDSTGEMAALALVNLGTSVVPAQLCGGTYHYCAKTTLGKIKCWGRNDYGHLGIGSTTHRGDDANEMGDNLPFVDLGTGRTATKVTCGIDHTCALLDNKKVKCWGTNGSGQLGQGVTNNIGIYSTQMGNALPYINFGTNRSVVELDTRGSHNCVVLDNNDVKCWGANQWGQLGLGHSLNIGDQLGEMGDALPPIDLQ